MCGILGRRRRHRLDGLDLDGVIIMVGVGGLERLPPAKCPRIRLEMAKVVMEAKREFLVVTSSKMELRVLLCSCLWLPGNG